ncbi:uncharacterized protein LOC135085137 [Ostrinia nubilalis]|uniref:uncharacterized protein LOC135085137 n=1 Tax=Ostrinia nubilalis TaxID=29057 RepID=UPI0030825DE5
MRQREHPRLKMLDYRSLLAEDVIIRDDLSSSRQILSSIEAELKLSYNTSSNEVKVQKNEVKRRTFNFVRRNNKYSIEEAFKDFNKLLHHKNFFTDIQKEVDKMADTTDNKCSTLLKKAAIKPNMLKRILGKCTRKSNVEMDFLNGLTNVLNKYTTKIKFDNDMTRILLQKILGSNMDLRNGIFDIKKILNYLKIAIENREQGHDEGLPTVKLANSHCLSAHLAGCFCKRGFVEHSGRCVEPSNCTEEKSLAKYMARIIVY